MSWVEAYTDKRKQLALIPRKSYSLYDKFVLIDRTGAYEENIKVDPKLKVSPSKRRDGICNL